VQAAADPDVSSPGALSDTLHRRSTGIREGSLWILRFGRRLTVLHQVQVHVGHLRFLPIIARPLGGEQWSPVAHQDRRRNRPRPGLGAGPREPDVDGLLHRGRFDLVVADVQSEPEGQFSADPAGTVGAS